MLSRAEVQNKSNTLRLMITQNENPSEKQLRQATILAFDLLTDALEKLSVVVEAVGRAAAKNPQPVGPKATEPPVQTS